MDKETLSNYGWIVICTLVLAVMIALATPFGEYIKDGVWSATNGLNDTLNKNMEIAGLSGSSDDNPNQNQPTTPLHFGEKYYVTECDNADMIMIVYYIFYEDGSATVYNGEDTNTLPTGYVEYTETEVKPTNSTPAKILENGAKLNADGMIMTLESALPNGFAIFTDGTMLSWGEIKNKYNVTDTAINERAFCENKALIYISLPDGVTNIGNHAFASCSSLTNITIPNSVTNIGIGAFASTSLASITIPDSVTTIEMAAFGYCNIENITIPSSVTSVGRGLFQSSNIKNVTILEGLTTISEGMFLSCVSLESVTVPASVTHIEEWAFYGYSGKIVYKGTINQWNAIIKHSDWNHGSSTTQVTCSDGIATL